MLSSKTTHEPGFLDGTSPQMSSPVIACLAPWNDKPFPARATAHIASHGRFTPRCLLRLTQMTLTTQIHTPVAISRAQPAVPTVGLPAYHNEKVGARRALPSKRTDPTT